MRFGMSELKSDNFYQNIMKNLRGGISRKFSGDFFPEAVDPVQPRAGYPAVPESRRSLSRGPT